MRNLKRRTRNFTERSGRYL